MARKRRLFPHVTLPLWTIDQTNPGGATLAAALELCDDVPADGELFTLAADSQRRALGFPVFGKKRICRQPGGKDRDVQLVYSSAYGTDSTVTSFTWAEITEAARKKRYLG